MIIRDAEFMELECELTQEQEDTYNEAVSFWKVHLLSNHQDPTCPKAAPIVSTMSLLAQVSSSDQLLYFCLKT